jgi:hypothetical protein
MNPEKLPLVFTIGETGYAEVLQQKQGELRDKNHERRRQRRRKRKPMAKTTEVQDQKPTNGAETAESVKGKQDVVPSGGESESKMQMALRVGAKGVRIGVDNTVKGIFIGFGAGLSMLVLDYFNVNPFRRG